MRDNRDYVIAALAAALLFCVGLMVGQGISVLPRADAQEEGSSGGGVGPEDTYSTGGPATGQPPAGVTVGGNQGIRPGFESRTSAPTASDSNSNNRFVAITAPIGSGESVLFVLDAESEHLCAYRFQRGKGLEFMAGRKIDYDLKINEWNDISRFSREQMRREYARQMAKATAEAVKTQKD